jgi:hypothetical protein
VKYIEDDEDEELEDEEDEAQTVDSREAARGDAASMDLGR